MTEPIIYKNPKRSIAERLEDLLSRMTLEEKIGQLTQIDGRAPDIVSLVREKHLGSILCVLDEQTIAAQKAALESRLGIPLLIGIDAIHGHSFKFGATIFPSQLGASCAWNEEMLEEMARITALEASYTGVHWTFSPVFCLPRDLRWGRVNETFGEDPHLIGKFGAAMVRGYQGDDLSNPRNIAACAKHFAGYGETHGGRDSSEADHSRRKMRSYFLPPFEKAVEAGVATFMTGYEAVDGVPCVTNRWLLTDVLRDEWGFEGMVVTDWNCVGALVSHQRTCATMGEAARLSVEAGNDMMMSTLPFVDAAIEEANAGRLSMEALDNAVRRVLRLKFQLGLFEDVRLPDPEGALGVIGCYDHHQAALQAARESIVLLKNRDLLPLDASRLMRIAVIGPNANNPGAQLGDWSLGANQQTIGDYDSHPRSATTTVLDGIISRFGDSLEITYSEGCGMKEPLEHRITEAVRQAEAADVVILALGDQSGFIGESLSTATLELPGAQQALFDAVIATGTPVIVVFIASKPLAIPKIAAKADALLCAFNPGMEGGTALAEIIAGDISPIGKLTISFPHHVGQQPVYYNQLPGQHGEKYADLPDAGFKALFPFGFGLSYTTFRYAPFPRLEKSEIAPGESVRAQVDISNTGEHDGLEIVQCYLQDSFTSATWPTKTLVDYQRVAIPSGKTVTVSFEIPYERLAIVNAEAERVVEPGEFVIMIGTSSRDEDLRPVKFTVIEK